MIRNLGILVAVLCASAVMAPSASASDGQLRWAAITGFPKVENSLVAAASCDFCDGKFIATSRVLGRWRGYFTYLKPSSRAGRMGQIYALKAMSEYELTLDWGLRYRGDQELLESAEATAAAIGRDPKTDPTVAMYRQRVNADIKKIGAHARTARTQANTAARYLKTRIRWP